MDLPLASPESLAAYAQESPEPIAFLFEHMYFSVRRRLRVSLPRLRASPLL